MLKGRRWKVIIVVAGIIRRNGQFMLCQRKPGGSESLKWEFPGGKVEAGESPEEALKRELREELAIDTETGFIFDARYRHDQDLLILFYHSTLLRGEPTPIDCTAVTWAPADQLNTYDLAPMDAWVAARLQEI
ncbi:MAG: (deoxy)nucleoside triphosphate pyrophosphohydrolase [Christensenellales bacterium]|nr:(deoxy)nucleoside triphosphate pyrophosphohydrolase [Christensenellales bacterium]